MPWPWLNTIAVSERATSRGLTQFLRRSVLLNPAFPIVIPTAVS